MSRREMREHLFRMLFRKDFYDLEELKEQTELYLEMLTESKEEEIGYLRDKFQNMIEQMDEIDVKIEEVATGWKLNRMSKVDLTIIRLAVYEIFYDSDIPNKVAINEAVEIGKIFGEDNSPGFINGILGKLV